MSLGRVYFKLANTIFTLVIIFACTMLMVENKYFVKPSLAGIEAKGKMDPPGELTSLESKAPARPYIFHEMLYYVVVTMTTTGYGDIYPMTPQGQMLFISIIIIGLFVISQQLGELQKVISLHSSFGGASYVGTKQKKHILLLGNFNGEALNTFLTECFHADHGKTETDVVIMRNSEPGPELNAILKDPALEQKVFYIKGNSIHAADLKRCLVHKADCCVIMSNPFD